MPSTPPSSRIALVAPEARPAWSLSTLESTALAAGANTSAMPEPASTNGATNAIRELGGVLGIAVLATVFSSNGSYVSGHAFISGLVPAMWVGVAVLGAGAVVAAAVPFSTRAEAAVHAKAEAEAAAAPAAPAAIQIAQTA